MAFAKLRKSRIFKSKLFSNAIKVKLFVADNHCYIPLHLNKLADSVHLFQSSQYTYKRKSSLKEKLDMGCFGNRLHRCVFITGP